MSQISTAARFPVPRIETADTACLPLDDCSVDLVITSPPYGLDMRYTHGDTGADGWAAMLEKWLREWFRVARRLGGRLALNVPLDTTRPEPRPTYATACAAAQAAGWRYRSTILWHEGNVSKSTGRGSVDSASAPHIFCFPESTLARPVGDVKSAFRRHYEGELVDISTSSGQILFSTTPNHPILTTAGWTPAGLLKEGDDLIDCSRLNSFLPQNHIHHPESTMQEIFQSLLMHGTLQRMRGSRMDFHGDGQTHQVEVVRAYCNLGMENVPHLRQRIHERVFSVSNISEPFFERNRSLSRCLLSMQVSNTFFDFPWPTQAQAHRFGSVTHLKPGMQNMIADRRRVNSKVPGNLQCRGAFQIPFHHLIMTGGAATILYSLPFPSGADPYASIHKSPSDRTVTSKVRTLGSDLLKAFSGLVQPLRVLNVNKRPFSGHVYNLQTSSGLYTVSGIPAKNCRSEAVILFYRGQWKREDKGRAESDIPHQGWLDWTCGDWRFPGESAKRVGHPAPFPLELPRRLLYLLSFPGDAVLDPMCGSGTVQVAAVALGRNGIGFDISPEYVALARKRAQEASERLRRGEDVFAPKKPSRRRREAAPSALDMMAAFYGDEKDRPQAPGGFFPPYCPEHDRRPLDPWPMGYEPCPP